MGKKALQKRVGELDERARATGVEGSRSTPPDLGLGCVRAGACTRTGTFEYQGRKGMRGGGSTTCAEAAFLGELRREPPDQPLLPYSRTTSLFEIEWIRKPMGSFLNKLGLVCEDPGLDEKL